MCSENDYLLNMLSLPGMVLSTKTREFKVFNNRFQSSMNASLSLKANALRRFIARRWPAREIRSDQGTNIVGAQTALKKALGEMDHDDIQRHTDHFWLLCDIFDAVAFPFGLY